MEENVKENLEEKEANENISTDVSEDLKKCQAELDDTTDRLKRIMAEFENYKKRSSKERENLYGSIIADIVEKMIRVLDNL